MAGEAKTEAFMLGTATIMLGAMADLMQLGTAQSIGLVKNVTPKSTPGFTDLTQGVKNTLVYSVMTANDVVIDGEMYEYTGKNLSYSLGLDGSSVVATDVVGTVGTAITAPTPPALTVLTLVLGTGEGADFAVNDHVFVEIGSGDQVFPRKITAITTDTLTVDYGFPVAIPLGTKVSKVNVTPVGSLADQPYLACKIVGKLANGDDIVMLVPKVRVVSGISLAFKTDKFDFIPLQLKVYDLVSTDPFYTYFQTVGPQGQPAKATLMSKQ